VQLDNDIKAAKQMRLPWWGVLCWMIGCALIVWLFDHLGRFDLARPVLYSVGMLGAAIAMKWKLRRHVWFWITVTLFVALHVVLIVFIPWTTKWIPAIVIIPIGIADFYAMLAILSVVGKFVERPRAYQK
jgi:hypothetical protein